MKERLRRQCLRCEAPTRQAIIAVFSLPLLLCLVAFLSPCRSSWLLISLILCLVIMQMMWRHSPVVLSYYFIRYICDFCLKKKKRKKKLPMLVSLVKCSALEKQYATSIILPERWHLKKKKKNSLETYEQMKGRGKHSKYTQWDLISQ